MVRCFSKRYELTSLVKTNRQPECRFLPQMCHLQVRLFGVYSCEREKQRDSKEGEKSFSSCSVRRLTVATNDGCLRRVQKEEVLSSGRVKCSVRPISLTVMFVNPPP